MRALDPRLLNRTRSARPLLVVDTLLGLATVVPVLLQATLLAHIVARAFNGASLSDLRHELVLLAAAFAARGVLAWWMEVAGRRAASSVLSELRIDLVQRRLRGQPVALDGAGSGEVAAAAVQGVEALGTYFGRYLPQVVLACLVPFAVVGFVASVDVDSALIMLLTLPLVPVFMWLIGRYTEQRTRERWYALSALSGHFLDVVRGLPTLRAFNRGAAQADSIADVSERHRKATMGTLRVSFLSGSVLELAATLGVALVAVTVGVRLVDGGIGLQSGLTVLVLAPELYLPFRRLGAEYHASADGLAVAERMFALLEEPDTSAASGPVLPPSPAEWPVRFDHVSFAYPARPGLEVLHELDLELPPGEMVALVGESGSGKSTVAALLLCLIAPSEGRIRVGRVDLTMCDLDAWREQIAWVPQHPSLLRGSVADNICLGSGGASPARVEWAAALAGAHEFISALPAGYDTIVGDGGRPLSPGERRRIALARAFLRNAPLVILDEPTADLDSESIEQVSLAIERLRPGRTLLVIAHRPELAQQADRVIQLEHGVVSPLHLSELA